jgi:ferric-dicitrate binding protein FerR (iron transport regulator)
MNIPEDIDALIAKECAGELEDSERNTLVSWIESESEHADLYAESKAYFDAINRYASADKIDLDNAWANFQVKKDETRVVPIAQPKKRNEFLRVAAVFIALVGVVKIVDLMMVEPVSGSQMQIVSTIGGQTMQVMLPDSSIVDLNENSRLEYPVQFAANERVVNFEGEAFFTVQRNEKKQFSILTESTEIAVLGTSFNLRARPEEKNTVLFVNSGKVAFRELTATKEEDENARILVAGESALFSEESGFEDVSANENDLFWKNKSLVFEGEKLREVVRLLELNYQVSIEFSTKRLGNCRLTATFEDKSIEEVLEVIALTQGLELEDTPKGYKLIGEGCE